MTASTAGNAKGFRANGVLSNALTSKSFEQMTVCRTASVHVFIYVQAESLLSGQKELKVLTRAAMLDYR